jgi:hypothetical protein
MASHRESTGAWKSEQVIVALVSGVAVVLVAIIGLVGVLGGNDGFETRTVEPLILIRETAFTAHSRGEVEIRVTGIVRDFPPEDRLYAIAKPAAVASPTSWWVSQEVEPNLGGDWVAHVLAAAEPGRELSVSAVRIQAGYSPRAYGEPPEPAALSADIRTELQRFGPDEPGVRGASAPLLLPPPHVEITSGPTRRMSAGHSARRRRRDWFGEHSIPRTAARRSGA